MDKAKKECTQDNDNSPCRAAFDTLNNLPSHETMSGRLVTCPECQRTWRGEYRALNRWRGDKGAAFDWRLY